MVIEQAADESAGQSEHDWLDYKRQCEVIATARGLLPTVMGAPAVLVAVSIGITVVESEGWDLMAQCHVEERDRVFWAGGALSGAAGGVFSGE